MDVFQCVAWGATPEEIISHDLVLLVEQKFRKTESFQIKSVPENTDPSRVRGAVIGFYPSYGVAYLSNPEKSSGLSGIDFENRRMIFSRNEGAFYEQRDAIAYTTGFTTYVRVGYLDVLKEFQTRGFTLNEFSPKYIGDILIRYNSAQDIPFSRSISVENLL